MRVLLVVSPYKYPNTDAPKSELLGVAYLAASLRRQGHSVAIFDPTIGAPQQLNDGLYYYGVPDSEIIAQIKSFLPDVVGLSCHYAFSRDEAYRLCRLFKEININITTIIGGLFLTVYKEIVLSECLAIDYGLIGESEESLNELLLAISSEMPLENIDGLVYRLQENIIVNDKKKFIEDIDSIPYPARDLMDIKRYMNTTTTLYGRGGKASLSLLTSRSCPNQCTFCNMWLVHGRRWRARSPENVLGEIDEMVNKYKVEHVYIMDDNFTFNPERAKEICRGIIHRGYKFTWNTPNGISVKGMDAELASLMKQSGCVNVCLAIESGSKYIRNDVVKKQISNEQIISAIDHFHKIKVPVGGYFVLGMPGENKIYFEETVTFIKRLNLSFIVVSFATPYPGTKLYEDWVRAGVITKDFQLSMDNLSVPVIATDDFTFEDLLYRKRRLAREFYKSHIGNIILEYVQGRLNWVNHPRKFFSHLIDLLVRR